MHAARLGKNIIGPATVGGIKPGCFKIGNTGGSIDNIIASRLYRPGRCAAELADQEYLSLAYLYCFILSLSSASLSSPFPLDCCSKQARSSKPSVAYVSRSGGMSNELNNIVARNTNGVYEGVAIGGDRYIFFVALLK